MFFNTEITLLDTFFIANDWLNIHSVISAYKSWKWVSWYFLINYDMFTHSGYGDMGQHQYRIFWCFGVSLCVTCYRPCHKAQSSMKALEVHRRASWLIHSAHSGAATVCATGRPPLHRKMFVEFCQIAALCIQVWGKAISNCTVYCYGFMGYIHEA